MNIVYTCMEIKKRASVLPVTSNERHKCVLNIHRCMRRSASIYGSSARIYGGLVCMNVVHTCMEINKEHLFCLSHKNELPQLCAEPP